MTRRSLLATFLLAGTVGLAATAPPTERRLRIRRSNESIHWPAHEPSRFVFFAVLEGLYRDGVEDADLARILPAEDDEERPSPIFEPGEHFVKGCPLCRPVADAMRLYRRRPAFAGFKEHVDTFGRGLPTEEVVALTSDEPLVRHGALETLVRRWVGQRVETLRLDPDEQDRLLRGLQEAGDEGEDMLELARHRGRASWRESCASCLGAVGACKAPER